MTDSGSQRLIFAIAHIGVVLTLVAMPSLGEENGLWSRASERRAEGEFLGELLEALTHDTVGSRGQFAGGYPPSPQVVTPPGGYSLSISGDFALGGFVFKHGYSFLHDDGGLTGRNTALGLRALISSTPGVPDPDSGKRNTALGTDALQSNTTGESNTATGSAALSSNTTGSRNTATGGSALQFSASGSNNTASGTQALFSNTSGSWNTAAGETALRDNTTGSRNTAVGRAAAFNNTSGVRNTALGYAAGQYNETGSNNIWIGNYGIYPGVESNTLRIGKGTGTGDFQQDRAFISGIRGATGTFDQTVCTDAADQLGPCSPSSARFKEDIEEMSEASAGVFGLRPVRFRYKREFAGKAERSVRYGLIAEEVAELYPGLVTYDPEGRAVTVRYDALTPMLLNELQKQQSAMAGQEARLREQEAELAALRSRLARIEAKTAREGPDTRIRR